MYIHSYIGFFTLFKKFKYLFGNFRIDDNNTGFELISNRICIRSSFAATLLIFRVLHSFCTCKIFYVLHFHILRIFSSPNN